MSVAAAVAAWLAVMGVALVLLSRRMRGPRDGGPSGGA